LLRCSPFAMSLILSLIEARSFPRGSS
jgi:hypothetical protein